MLSATNRWCCRERQSQGTHAPGPAPPCFLRLNNPKQPKPGYPLGEEEDVTKQGFSRNLRPPQSLTLGTARGHSPETSSARRPARPALAWACWPGSPLPRSSSALQAPGDESGVCPGKLREDVDPPRPPLPLGPTQWTVPPRSLARRAKAEPGRRLLSQTRNRHIGRNPRSSPPTEAAQWARLPLPAGTPCGHWDPTKGGGADVTTRHAWQERGGGRERERQPRVDGKGQGT